MSANIKLLINGIDYTPLISPSTFTCNIDSTTQNSLDVTLIAPSDEIPPGAEVLFYNNNTLVFGGLISTVTPTILHKRVGVVANKSVTINALGYASILSRRTVSMWLPEGTNATCGGIVKSLISKFLSVDGITPGNILDGGPILEWKNPILSAKEALDSMASASGYSWWVDNAKRLHFTNKVTMSACSKQIKEDTYDPPEYYYKALLNISASKDLETYCNKIFIVGVEDTEEENTIYGSATNEEDVAYMSKIYGSGVYGKIINDGKIITKEDAAAIAKNSLLAYGGIPQSLTFTTIEEDIVTNSLLYINMPSLYITEDTLYYINNTVYKLSAGNIVKDITCIRIKPDKAPQVPNTKAINTLDTGEYEVIKPIVETWTTGIEKLKSKNTNSASNKKVTLTSLNIGSNTINATYTNGKVDATYTLDTNGYINSISIKGGQTIPITYN